MYTSHRLYISGPFQSTGARLTLPSPICGWARSPTGHLLIGLKQTFSLSAPFPALHTRTHTQQNSLLQSGRREAGIYFWQAPRGGLRGLVTDSPLLLQLVQASPLISPPWISDHPLCSAPGQDTLLPGAFTGFLPLTHIP